MDKLKEVADAIKTINSCRSVIKELQYKLDEIVKIFDNVGPGDVLTIADKLKTLPDNLIQTHSEVSDVIWDLTEGSLPDITRCEVCEKVIVHGLDEVEEWCGSGLCKHCYDEFSRQAEDDDYGTEIEVETDEEEEKPEKSLIEIARQKLDVDKAMATVQDLMKLFREWREDTDKKDV